VITKLKLRNFQSHKRTDIEFNPGVNVIVGQSDSGKTAILRALRWLVWNRPLGDEYRSNWGGETEIEIHLTTPDLPNPAPLVIKRRRDKIDEYIFLNKEQIGHTTESIHKPHIFKAFGKAVPEEIQEALNIDEVNLQQQLDSPFLLTSSPGEVAQHFNKIAHLDQIDSGLKNVQRWMKQIQTNIDFENEAIKDAKEDLKKYSELDKMEIEVEALEEAETQKNQKISGKVSLLKTLGDIEALSEAIEAELQVTKAGPLIDSLLALYEDMSKVDEDVETLSILIHDIETISIAISENKKLIVAKSLVEDLIGMEDLLGQKQSVVNSLRDSIRELNTTTLSLESNKTELRIIEDRFDKEFPDICPLCDKPK